MKARIDEFKVRQRLKGVEGIDTIQELAKAAELGENTLYRSLKGYNWKSNTLNSIADVLNCNPVDLLTVDPKPAPAGLGPVFA